MPVDRVSMPAVVREALASASAATGVEFAALAETARRESSFNPAARAPTSSATGLFQFIESTWLEMVRRHGAEHGLAAQAAKIETRGGRPYVADPAARREILDLRLDPLVSAKLAGELTQENAGALKAALGRSPSRGELYAAHVFGPAGAVKLIRGAEAGVADASTLLPKAAAANPWLFKGPEGSRSAAALLEKLGAAGPTFDAPSQRVELPPTPEAEGLVDSWLHEAALSLLQLGDTDETGRSLLARAAYGRGASNTS